MTNQLDGSEVTVEYEIVDAMDLFMDAIGPERFDVLLASNQPELELDFDGDVWPLGEVFSDAEQVRDLIKTSDSWTAYSKPHTKVYGNSSRDAEDISAIDDASLRQHVERSGIEDHDSADVIIVSREVQGGRIQAATLMGQSFPMVAAASAAIKIDREFLFRGAGDEWRALRLPTVSEDTTISDIVPLHERGEQLLLVIDGEGFYSSMDHGQTWEDFNLGEKRLAAARSIKTHVVGVPPTVYVLLDNDLGGEGEVDNFLFKLERRKWLERLRMGLIRVLSSPAESVVP